MSKKPTEKEIIDNIYNIEDCGDYGWHAFGGNGRYISWDDGAGWFYCEHDKGLKE